jgi:hypothetical protein
MLWIEEYIHQRNCKILKELLARPRSLLLLPSEELKVATVDAT